MKYRYYIDGQNLKVPYTTKKYGTSHSPDV